MSKKYQIEKITDIFQIPKDKFDDFLVDFKAYYETGHNMTELLKATGDVLKTPVEVLKGGMTWIDDDRHDVKISIKTKPHPEETIKK